MSIKVLIVILVTLLLLLQYKMWIEKGSVGDVWRLEKQLVKQKDENQKLLARNKVLEAEVQELKAGDQAIEERARRELGMIRKGEVFYQIIKPSKHKGH